LLERRDLVLCSRRADIERYLIAVLIHQCSCLSGANLGDGTHPHRVS